MRFLAPFLLITLCLAACMDNTGFAPKRKGYFRIDMPEKQYIKYTGPCPYTFEYPVYAQVVIDKEPGAEPYWVNVVFPRFKGRIYVTYKVMDNNLDKYIEESRNFAVRHEVKASAINEQTVANSKEKVYGLIYDIEGNAASNMEFYLTDSAKSFVYGSLYFYSIPNKDSLEPVLQFIKKDVYHMIETFRWKNASDSTKP